MVVRLALNVRCKHSVLLTLHQFFLQLKSGLHYFSFTLDLRVRDGVHMNIEVSRGLRPVWVNSDFLVVKPGISLSKGVVLQMVIFVFLLLLSCLGILQVGGGCVINVSAHSWTGSLLLRYLLQECSVSGTGERSTVALQFLLVLQQILVFLCFEWSRSLSTLGKASWAYFLVSNRQFSESWIDLVNSSVRTLHFGGFRVRMPGNVPLE